MEQKIVIMIGSHLRHLYVADLLKKAGRLAGVIIEEREVFLPSPPEDIPEHDKENFRLHFKKRDEAEKKAFGNLSVEDIQKDIPHLSVTESTLNGDKVVEFLKSHPADYLFTYGVHKIEDRIIKLYEGKCFNIHGGLSPWYRGNTTLFWPFYFLKPNWAGMTIHRLTRKLDGGEILHHSVPELAYGDGIHDVACKAVKKVAGDIIEILKAADEGKELECYPQKSAGKLFMSRDWTPQTLRLIYDVFDDKIVDRYLEGELTRDDPNLISFFDKQN